MHWVKDRTGELVERPVEAAFTSMEERRAQIRYVYVEPLVPRPGNGFDLWRPGWAPTGTKALLALHSCHSVEVTPLEI